MKDPPGSSPWNRYLAVDLHKHYLVIGGVNEHQDVVLKPRRVELSAWPKWAQTHLRPTDTLVVEATTNTWDFCDHTRPLVSRLQVANAGKIALIAKTRVKTDTLDVLKLARLSVANLIPEVWVPPQDVRELRNLIAHRRRLTQMHTQIVNRLHSLLHRYHFLPPAGRTVRGPSSRLVGGTGRVTDRTLANAPGSRDPRPSPATLGRGGSGTGAAQYRTTLGRSGATVDATPRLWAVDRHDRSGRGGDHHAV